MKTTTWILPALMALALGAALVAVTGCNKSEHDQSGHAHQYTCSHHPEVVQDKAGNCARCGMKLVEKK